MAAPPFEILKSKSIEGHLPTDFKGREKIESPFLANGKMKTVITTTVTIITTDY